MKAKANGGPELIQAQGLQVQTLKPESGAPTKIKGQIGGGVAPSN
jgi:hypothetical protein